MKNFLFELKEGILISLKAISVNKMRAVLTTLGIIIGIVAVTTMSTAIVGLRDAFVSSISSLGNDVLYVDKFEWMSGKDWRLYRNRKDITYKQYEKLRKMLSPSSFVAMAPTKRTFGKTVKYKQLSTQAAMIYGTNADYMMTSGAIPEEGRFMNPLEVKSARRVCIIGKDIAKALFPNQNPLNKSIRLNNVPLKVIGVLEKQGSAFFGSFSLDGQIIMPLNVFERIYGQKRGRILISIKVADINKMAEVKEEVKADMRLIRKVPPGKPDDFAINEQNVFTDFYDKTVGIIALAGIVITALSLFVGAIGIMNIMFVSVTERTKEIGIRKAIGAKTRSIMIQFLSEAIIITLIGGIIGLIISYPLSLIIDKVLPTSMPINIVILALVISIVVGIISGFLPAYKAAKMDPVDALRYD
ncbi:macrolide export ATP-binding/permease protein MacB [bacterium BMS3Abin04]|nr:macrolide export ATP-binding/permease protein MacB [bacterium BMS3Abin04]